MNIRTAISLAALVVLTAAGCRGDNQPKFPDLNPVKGTVKRGTQPVNGGVVTLTAEGEQNPEFLINGEVGPDGTFVLSTVRTTDSRGERKPGAPAGKYQVTYQPPLGDQTAGGENEAVQLPAPVDVRAGNNDLPIGLPKK